MLIVEAQAFPAPCENLLRPSSSAIEPIAWLLAALLAWPWDFAPATLAPPARRATAPSPGPGILRDGKGPIRARVAPALQSDDLDDPDDACDGLTTDSIAGSAQAVGRVAAGRLLDGLGPPPG